MTIRPPDALLTPCDTPNASNIETNEDLIRYINDLVLSHKQCAAKVDGIIIFFEGNE